MAEETIEKNCTVRNKMGVHARPAALIVQTANRASRTPRAATAPASAAPHAFRNGVPLDMCARATASTTPSARR